MVDIQTHKASEKSKSGKSSNSSKKISIGDIRVRIIRLLVEQIIYLLNFSCRLRKVKMDQRKLLDNANTITDMAKVMRITYTI